MLGILHYVPILGTPFRITGHHMSILGLEPRHALRIIKIVTWNNWELGTGNYYGNRIEGWSYHSLRKYPAND